MEKDNKTAMAVVTVKMEPVDDFTTATSDENLQNQTTIIGTVHVLNTQIKAEISEANVRTENGDHNLNQESIISFVKIEQSCDNAKNDNNCESHNNGILKDENFDNKTESNLLNEDLSLKLNVNIKQESDENSQMENVVVNSVVKIKQDVFDNFDNVTNLDQIKQEIHQGESNNHKRNKSNTKTIKSSQIKQENNEDYEEEFNEMDNNDEKTEENRVTCKLCGKSLFNESTLRRHMRIHAPEHVYPCKWCGKKFNKKTMLKKHSRKHNGEKPFVCNECGMSFSWNGSLGRHKKIHTGEKPFKCEICDKAFARSSYLESHMAMHTGERRYTCPVCGKLFADQPGLIRHSRTHTGETPYKCEECGKSVTSKRSLRDHIMIHTGERPYICIEPGCEKSFRVPNGLAKHAEIHLKVRHSHACSICNKQYSYISGLKRHLKTHTEPTVRKKRGANEKKMHHTVDTKLNIKTDIGNFDSSNSMDV